MPRRTYTGEIAPDHLRCRRSDGRKWRCPLHAMEGLTFCEHHYHMSRRHLAKNQRPSSSSASAAASSEDPVNPAKKRSRAPRPPSPELAKRRRRGRNPTAAEEPLGGTINRRVGREEKEKRMESPEPLEEADEEEGDIVRDLPKGVMTISPPPKKDRRGNAGSPFAEKLEIEEGLALRRPIRSKNAEPIPVATVKRIPAVKGLRRRRKNKTCHRCGEKIVEHMIQCSICRKGFFCSSCIKKWFFYLSEKEIKRACPVCRGCCDCKSCKNAEGEEGDKTKSSSPDTGSKSCENAACKDGENSGASDEEKSKPIPCLNPINHEESTKQENEETQCQAISAMSGMLVLKEAAQHVLGSSDTIGERTYRNRQNWFLRDDIVEKSCSLIIKRAWVEASGYRQVFSTELHVIKTPSGISCPPKVSGGFGYRLFINWTKEMATSD